MNFLLDFCIFSKDVDLSLFGDEVEGDIGDVCLIFTEVHAKFALFLRFSHNELDFFFVHGNVYLQKPSNRIEGVADVAERQLGVILKAEFICQIF